MGNQALYMETTLSNYREETKRRAAEERKKAIEEERRKEEARQRVEEEERRRAEEARVSERKFKEQSNGLRYIWGYEKIREDTIATIANAVQ